MKKHKGLIILVLSLIFNLLESLYFGVGTELGFNRKPQSSGELICDCISIIGTLVGIYFIWLKLSKKENE
jgi:hypothetical protein